jgi:hypothetical protein
LLKLDAFSDRGRQSQAVPLSSLRDWRLVVPAGYSLFTAVGAQAAARRAKRPNLFHDLAGLRQQAHNSAHRPRGNDAFRSRGFKFQLVHSPFYVVAAIIFVASFAAVFSPLNRDLEPSTHIRWRTVASLRATATLALVMPRRLAIFMPQGRKLDYFLLRTRTERTVSLRAARASSPPH